MRAEAAFFGKLVLPIAYGIVGDRRLRRLDELLARDRWSEGELGAYRVARLRALLEHAATHVPYYRDLFRERRFDWRAVASERDLEGLPPLERETVRANFDRLRSEAHPDAAVRRSATGGSTGSPIEYAHDRAYLEVTTAAAYRGRCWSGWRPGERMAWVWGAPQEVRVWQSTRGRIKSFFDRSLRCDAFRAGPAEQADWLRRFRRFRPAFVYGYASSLAHFGRFLLERSERLHGIRGVLSTAERLDAAQRETIESAFGAPVFDQYGSREVKAIASQCPSGSMHAFSDLNVVEVEGSGAGPAPFLLTALESYAMPFIRYRLGDVGSRSGTRCPCGRPFELLSLSIARETDMFVTPEGRELHGEYFTHLMYGVHGVERFQFHQTARDRILLRVVPSPVFDADTRAALDGVRRTVQREVSASIEVEVAIVDDVPPSPTGKHRFTLSDVGRDVRRPAS